MKITTELLYSHLQALQTLFSYKQCKKIDISRIVDLSKREYNTIFHRPNLKYVFGHYADLASSISSNRLTLRAIDLYYLGEFVRNKKFPNIKTISSEYKFRKAYEEFYSAKAIHEQIQRIINLSSANNTIFAKFTKTDKSVFEIDSKTQTNELYTMMTSGQINVYVFAYFYAQNKFAIDFSKIKDLCTYRNLKLVEYVKNFKLSEVLI